MKHQHLAVRTSTLASFSKCANPWRCSPSAHGGHRFTEVCSCGAWRDVNFNHAKWGIEYEYGRWNENTHAFPYGGGLWRAMIPADSYVLGTTEDIGIWVFRRDTSGYFKWENGSPLFFHSVHMTGDSWYCGESHYDSHKMLFVGNLMFPTGIENWSEEVKNVKKRICAIYDLTENTPRWAWPYAMHPNRLPGIDALERGPRPIGDMRGEVLAMFGSAGAS